MKLVVKFLILLSVLATTISRALAGDVIPPMPENLGKTRISLVTVGLGSNLYSRFGHTMLRIQDQGFPLDYLVNWGMFDFSDPFFIPKFFRGVLLYRMTFTPYEATIAYYRDREKRSVIEDELVLTNEQKKNLIEKIIWNAQPENVNYPYQYFRNNCATIPRDYLDMVLGGGIRRRFNHELVALTYRDYIRMNLASNSFVGWGLDVIFNSDVDRQLSKWEEMFYPLKLREYLADLPSFDNNGNERLDQRLFKSSRVVVQMPDSKLTAINGYLLTWLVSGIPMLSIMLSKVLRKQRRINLSANWHFRLFGMVSLWWGITSGFFGLTHFSAWLFSSHSDLYRNANIFLFWPIDMLVLIPGLQMLIHGREFGFSGFLKIGYWQKFAIFHLGLIIPYAIFSYFGFFAQNVHRVVIYMGPLSLLYYGLMAQLISESKSTQSQTGTLKQNALSPTGT